MYDSWKGLMIFQIEGEADIHLDNIMMQEKQQDSDSGSEFDFEVPATKTTQQPGVVPLESVIQEESNVVSRLVCIPCSVKVSLYIMKCQGWLKVSLYSMKCQE